MEAIESEVRLIENDVAEIKILLSCPETFPSPREESLKVGQGHVSFISILHQDTAILFEKRLKSELVLFAIQKYKEYIVLILIIIFFI